MKPDLGGWRALLRAGDVAVAVAGLGVCVFALLTLWRGGAPDGAVIRAGGKVVAEVDLVHARTIEVPGPLGVTVVEIRPGRARVASVPGPRQGWLTQAGAVAICAPNQVSLSLSGRAADYDSLNY